MKKYPLIYCFFLILIIFTASDIVSKEKKYSELENRNLKSKVDFSFYKYYKGSFQEKYEEYINDQFILRDNWINIKSISEFVLGKQENNGIIYGENDYLFDKFISMDEYRVGVNINSLNKFIESVNADVTTMIVPNSYEIYKEYINWPVPLVNQEKELVNIYEQIEESNNINLIEIMNKNKDNYLYYKTDHHWTSYGAYIAYEEYMKSINEEPIDFINYKKEEVDNFYGTYYSKSKPFLNDGDKLTYYNIDGITIEINGEVHKGLYDYSKLNSRDKYELFLYGNNPLTIVKNNNLRNGERLIVIKDSYANSMVPFLTQSFEEIHVVDLRSFSGSLQNYIKEKKFDKVLIVYNFINFTKESSIAKIKI